MGYVKVEDVAVDSNEIDVIAPVDAGGPTDKVFIVSAVGNDVKFKAWGSPDGANWERKARLTVPNGQTATLRIDHNAMVHVKLTAKTLVAGNEAEVDASLQWFSPPPVAKSDVEVSEVDTDIISSTQADSTKDKYYQVVNTGGETIRLKMWGMVDGGAWVRKGDKVDLLMGETVNLRVDHNAMIMVKLTGRVLTTGRRGKADAILDW